MESSDSFFFIALIIILFIWLLPLLSILFSNRTSGGEKLAWILAVLFISWFAWIFYLLLAPLKKKQQYPPEIPTNQYSSGAYTRRQETFEGSANPPLQQWLIDNPDKSVNDYYAKFGK